MFSAVTAETPPKFLSFVGGVLQICHQIFGMRKEDSAWASSSTDTTLVNTPEPKTPHESKGTVDDVASKIIDKMLYAFHESPVYQQDNHFILSGYRGELKSFQRCFGSIWYLHNETGENLGFLC
jgi:hypothetical protein